MTGGNTSHYTIADGIESLVWIGLVPRRAPLYARISWFRSNDLWVMGPARFLCAMTRRVPKWNSYTPAGNRTRGERMGTVHFTTKPLVFTRRPHQALCRNRGSNTGPSDGVPSLGRSREVGLQSDALPTELFRRTQAWAQYLPMAGSNRRPWVY